MVNLYWKNQKQINNIESRPFASESDLEKFIFNNQSILGGDIFIFKRQVRTGSKDGIPDMLGIDTDGQICIIELKNIEANDDIVPQVLGYAIWAEENPDSMKNLWIECKNKPEEFFPNWDNLDIRILLIAPSFKQSVLKSSQKIAYPVELYKINRYGTENDEFIEVEVLENKDKKIVTTKAKEEYSWEFYEQEYDKETTKQFKKIVDQIKQYCEKQNWNISYNLNKFYTGFKLGNRVVFYVHWEGKHAWSLIFKISENEIENFKSENWKFHKYDKNYNDAVFKSNNPENADINELDILFKKAYEGKINLTK